MVFTTNLFSPTDGLIDVSTAANAQNADVGIYKNEVGDPIRVVVWIEDNTVFAQRYGPGGNPLSAVPITVGEDAVEDSAPKVAVTPDGQIYVTYVSGLVVGSITVTETGTAIVDSGTSTGIEDDVTATVTVTSIDVDLVEGTDNVVVKKIVGDTVDASFDEDGVLEVDSNDLGALQSTPDIAAFNDGSFAVVWSEEAGGTGTAAGTVTATATGIVSSAVTGISTATGIVGGATALPGTATATATGIVSAVGTGVVVNTGISTGIEDDVTATATGIVSASATGAVVGSVTAAGATATGTGLVARTATDLVTATASGIVSVIGTETALGEDGDSDVYLRHYNADGSELTVGAVEIAAEDGIDEVDPAIAARPGSDPGEGNTAISVTWTAQTEDGEPTFDDVGLLRLDRQDTPEVVGGGLFSISGFQGDTDVALSGDGTTVATWTVADVRIAGGVEIGGNVNFIQIGAGGGILAAGAVANTDANERNSSVASSLMGEFVVAYQSGDQTFIQEYTADALPTGDPQLVEGVGPNPAIAVTQEGMVQDFLALAGENGSIVLQPLAQDLTGADFGGVDTLEPDRQADIVWRNATSGVNSTWLLDPNTLGRSNDPLLRAENNSAWEIVGVGDWSNGGANDDLLWRNEDTGELSVWDQTGIVFNTTAELSDDEFNLSWKIRAVGDMDGDGVRDDIVWQNVGEDDPSRGNISIWFMEGNVRVGTVDNVRTENNTNWELVGAGQVGGDELDDGNKRDELVFHNIGPDDPSRGVVSVWFLNQSPVFSPSDPATLNNGLDFASSQVFDRQELNVGTADERQWRLTGVADFDGQGTGDFLWRNFQTGANSIWLTEENNPLQLDTIVATDTESNPDWVSIA